MLQNIMGSILENGAITGEAFFMATACSLLIGLFIGFMYTKTSHASKSFIITLAILPAIVQLIIMLVNGNIGAGVAVAGAFGLVRFRSAAGSAQEIVSIFLAMAVGLATGMGYLGIAAAFAVIISLVNLFLQKVHFGESSRGERVLKIFIPEDLDFEGVFDDLFAKYTDRAELVDVRTTDMGSLYRLQYNINMRANSSMKEMMDAMRERNGNLEISCGRPTAGKAEEL